MQAHAPVVAHPVATPSGEAWIDSALIPTAAELVGLVRDYGPDAIEDLLDRVPDHDDYAHTPGGRYGALCVALAAMVDPDKPLSELLGWLHAGPVQSRDGKEPITGNRAMCADCGRWMRVGHLARHRRIHGQADTVAVEERLAGRKVKTSTAELDAAIAELTGRGLSQAEIADRLRVTTRTVARSRARTRHADDDAQAA